MDNMVKVSQEVFYKTVGQMNVHPSVLDSTEYTVWKKPTYFGSPDDPVVGRSYPGWKNPDGPKEYYVRIDVLWKP